VNAFLTAAFTRVMRATVSIPAVASASVLHSAVVGGSDIGGLLEWAMLEVCTENSGLGTVKPFDKRPMAVPPPVTSVVTPREAFVRPKVWPKRQGLDHEEAVAIYLAKHWAQVVQDCGTRGCRVWHHGKGCARRVARQDVG